MAETVYVLCALTSLACAALLFRGYSRSGARLLMWAGLCFVGLAINNILLFVDKVVLPDKGIVLGLHFAVWRSLAAVIGLALLVVGLIWDTD